MVPHNPLGCPLVTAFLLTIYFTASCNAQSENTYQPEVTIPQGTLLGKILTTRHGRNISAFMGVPFAQPPTGDLRFANPVAAEGWNGTLDATVDPVFCAQAKMNTIQGDEDCLYLNVYTPQLSQSANSSLLPVMVYVHGGAFQTEGHSSTGRGGPDYLLDADVVLVSISYRMGPLGFLSTGDEVASGNWGLKDQVLALEWVQDNIQYFGGDPEQVTLFGESAGAISVHLLTLSDTTIGLFHRYITQSGSALGTSAYRPSAAYSSRAFELGGYVGCYNDTSDSLINCLRKIDFSDIIATRSQFNVWESLPDIVWGPTDEPNIEGAFLTDSPKNLFAAGKIRDLPWISGIVRDEGLLHTSALYEDEAMFYNFLENIDTILPIMLLWDYESDAVGAARTRAAKSFYFNNDLTSNTSVLLKNLTMLVSDSHFNYPAYNALRQQHALAVNPQYFYTLNYRGTFSYSYAYGGSTVNYGVSHADELIYLFPLESFLLALNESMSETDNEIVDAMVQLWTSFAINGTPTASALDSTITWQPYSAEDNYLRIGNDSDVALENQYSFIKERMDFWANIDAATEEQADSGTVTSIPNFFILLLVACWKFVLSAATADRFG